MKLLAQPRRLWSTAVLIGGAVFGVAHADSDFVNIAGAPCSTPPALHCPASECSTAMVINEGTVVEMKTRRTYFLDYPCDLKRGEKVTFVLSLHGGGSYGNWQRNYFPIMDYKDKYRLVIATPNSPIRVWTEADDQYLRNIVDFVVSQIGKENIRAFWLVGHSQGGMTSNRLLRTEYFKDRVDGWLSLSGGRIGGNPVRASTFGVGKPGAMPKRTPGSPDLLKALAALRKDPDGDFSFIYSTGRREMNDNGLPETSTWADKYHCGARAKVVDVVDTQPGYVYDNATLNNLNPSWGLLPAGGKAEVFEFPKCDGGRIVADAQRLDKGHTEGYEPHITEQLVKMLVSAPGGKLQHLQ